MQIEAGLRFAASSPPAGRCFPWGASPTPRSAARYVRHPSHGGAAAFATGLQRLRRRRRARTEERRGRDEDDRPAGRQIRVVGDGQAREHRAEPDRRSRAAIVERMLQATRLAAMTGSTISAAISRMPTIRIESATVSAASTARTTLSSADRHTGDPRALLVEHGCGERRGRAAAIVASRQLRARRTSAKSPRVTVRIEPKRYGEQARRRASRRARRARFRRRSPCRRRARAPDRRPSAAGFAATRSRCAPITAATSAVQDAGRLRAGVPAATPAKATWPMPSPMRLIRRSTRKKPTAGASTPTTAPVAKREPHELGVKHGRAKGRARRRGGSAGPSKTIPPRTSTRRSRSARPRRTRARRRGS